MKRIKFHYPNLYSVVVGIIFVGGLLGTLFYLNHRKEARPWVRTFGTLDDVEISMVASASESTNNAKHVVRVEVTYEFNERRYNTKMIDTCLLRIGGISDRLPPIGGELLIEVDSSNPSSARFSILENINN